MGYTSQTYPTLWPVYLEYIYINIIIFTISQMFWGRICLGAVFQTTLLVISCQFRQWAERLIMEWLVGVTGTPDTGLLFTGHSN